jgi:putative membrane protein
MKKKFVLPCALASIVSLGACSVYAQTNHPAGHATTSKGIVKTSRISTTAYVPRAQTGSLFEIEASKIAVQRAQKKEVKDFAQRMVDDHSRAAMKFDAAVQKSGITPKPVGLDTESLNKLEVLKAASTSAFDRTYVAMQVEAHEKSLSLHQGYASAGDKAPLKMAAQDSVPMIQHHLQDIRSISADIASNP